MLQSDVRNYIIVTQFGQKIEVSIKPFCLVARSAGTKQPRALLVSDFTLYASNTPTLPRPQSPLISKPPQIPVPAANLGTTSEE